MVLNPKRKDKIEKFILRSLPNEKLQIYEWVEFQRFDAMSGQPVGDVIYITLNSSTNFDKKSNNKICEEISKFFNVECVIDVFSYYK
jgi:flagellar basal body L-ring protein FlgH